MEFTAINLKAGTFTFPVLELLSGDIDRIAREVGEKVDQAPAFFHNAPVVIDLKFLPDDETVEFAVLVGVLRSYALNPVAIRGGTPGDAELAENMELAVFGDERGSVTRVRERSNEAGDDAGPEKEAPAEVATSVASRIHLRPVRSGQNLAAPTGDLVVIASTSPGSELVAAGNIHVYGALRGRALAGISGDESCRIFCQRLEAELVSIAGQYRVSEDIDDSLRGQPVQIYLDADKLKISPIGES